MDEAAGNTAPDDEPGPDGPAERRSGIILESCYRHPRETTGVHCTRCGRPICPECMRPAAVGYQCPDCVAEARRTYPRRRVRIQFILGRPGFFTSALLVANIAMFLVEVVASRGGLTISGGFPERTMVSLGAMQPLLVAHSHQYWRLVTVMFLHADLLHIMFNMYALYLFGYLIENALGKARFLAVYFITGFVASAASYTLSDPHAVAVGASGAIFGLLGAWVAYNFRRRNLAANRFQLQWAFFLIAINVFLGLTIATIDNFAHIGGLVAGVIAGWAAEGAGPPATRQAIAVIGFGALIAIGLLMTTLRTAALT